MSLQQRLKNIEQRLSALEANQQGLAQSHETLVNTLIEDATEDDEQPQLTLDGDQAGGERDQSQPL